MFCSNDAFEKELNKNNCNLHSQVPKDTWMPRGSLGYMDGANLYEYVSSEPVVLLDPLGLEEISYNHHYPGARKIGDDVSDYRQPEGTNCDTWATPGYGGIVPQVMVAAGITSESDLLKNVTTFKNAINKWIATRSKDVHWVKANEKCECGFFKVMVMHRRYWLTNDYHFAHEHVDGTWSHQDGATTGGWINDVALGSGVRSSLGTRPEQLLGGGLKKSTDLVGYLCLRGDPRNPFHIISRSHLLAEKVSVSGPKVDDLKKMVP